MFIVSVFSCDSIKSPALSFKCWVADHFVWIHFFLLLKVFVCRKMRQSRIKLVWSVKCVSLYLSVPGSDVSLWGCIGVPCCLPVFSTLQLGVARDCQIIGAVICSNCIIHCVFRQTDGHLSSLTVLVPILAKKQQKAVNQLLCKWHLILFPL